MTFATIRQSIRSSLYDPSFYSQLRGQSIFTEPLKIYAALGILGFGVTLGILYANAVPLAFSSLPDQVVAVYPNDGLAITLASGQMSINKPQPYYVMNPLSKKWLGTSTPKYLVIFDGDDTLGMDLDQNSTFALVKKTYIIAPEGNENGSKITIFSKEEATTTLTKVDVVSFIDSIKPYFAPTLIIGGFILVVLSTIIGTFFWIVYHYLYCIFPAVLIWIFMYLRKTPLVFADSYLTTLYASMPVVIVSFTLTILGLGLPLLSYTLFVLIIAIANLTKNTAIKQI